MNRIPSLKLLIAFEAVARLKSMSKAAVELNVTVSAISHRLSNLEALVGNHLLLKAGKGTGLTAAGERYYGVLTRALHQMTDLTRCLSPDSEESVLRVRSGPGFAKLWLIPRLDSFQKQHPGIRLDITTSFEPVDFRKEDIDIWVRRGPYDPGGYVSESLYSEHFVPLVSPAYLKRYSIKDISDLAGASLIYCTRSAPSWIDWFRINGLASPDPDWSVALEHADYSLQSAAQGLGVVLESLEFSESFRRDGRLVEIFPDKAAIKEVGQSLFFPQDHLKRPVVEKFRAWIRSELRP